MFGVNGSRWLEVEQVGSVTVVQITEASLLPGSTTRALARHLGVVDAA